MLGGIKRIGKFVGDEKENEATLEKVDDLSTSLGLLLDGIKRLEPL